MTTVNADTIEIGQYVATGGRYLGRVIRADETENGSMHVQTDAGYVLTLTHQSLDLTEWTPIYSKWRHGGWYVDNVKYATGAIGCVSRNYPDGKWRIVCDPRPDGHEHTYPSRDAAARAERDLATAAGVSR